MVAAFVLSFPYFAAEIARTATWLNHEVIYSNTDRFAVLNACIATRYSRS